MLHPTDNAAEYVQRCLDLDELPSAFLRDVARQALDTAAREATPCRSTRMMGDLAALASTNQWLSAGILSLVAAVVGARDTDDMVVF